MPLTSRRPGHEKEYEAVPGEGRPLHPCRTGLQALTRSAIQSRAFHRLFVPFEGAKVKAAALHGARGPDAGEAAERARGLSWAWDALTIPA